MRRQYRHILAPPTPAHSRAETFCNLTLSCSLQIYDCENELLHSFGVKGSNPGEMDLPYGVAVDSQNNIVVADMWNHRLSVYDLQGNFLNHILCAPGPMVRMPAHVSVSTGLNSDDYRLAVTDFSANHVKVFTY